MKNDIFKPLLHNMSAQHIMNIYHDAGFDIRFVGGCVRDCLANQSITDIDLATTAIPKEGINLLQEANIKVIPTGVDHGTITAILDNQSFEITTLRRDVATDGRRATIAYTSSWEEDASRRDFTINALSLDRDGILFDPYHGLKDLKAGRVCFIGDAHTRIQEDALRILRFFRFNAYIGEGMMDETGLEACVKHADKLQNLSKERIWLEVKKLLQGKNLLPIWQKITDHKINQYFLINSNNIKCLEFVINVKYQNKPLLLSLFKPEDRNAIFLQKALKLSNHATQALNDIIECSCAIWQEPKRVLYQYDMLTVKQAVILRYADGVIDENDMDAMIDCADKWRQPVFPVTGQDLLKQGYKTGPELGQALKKIEDYWIENDFKPSKAECLERL